MRDPACPACGYDPSHCIKTTSTLILKRGAQSLNELSTNTRHNNRYRNARRAWERLLTPYSCLEAPTNHCRVYFTRYWKRGKYGYDYGNLVGGFKPLLDALVRAGLLVDDSPKHITEYYDQRRSPDGTDYVQVVIEELHDET